MEERKFISDILQEDMIIPGRLNFIVSGCGSGKSHWAAHCAEFFSDVLSAQIIIVTSRSTITRQQVSQYGDTIQPFYFEHTDGDIVRYWNGDTSNPPAGYDKVNIMSYHAFAEMLTGGMSANCDLRNVRVIIFDECHSIVGDTHFMKATMSVTSTAIMLLMRRQDLRIICMTATPENIFYEGSPFRYVRPHYVLEDPLFPYRVKRMTVASHEQVIALLQGADYEHRALVMCNHKSRRKDLLEQIPGACFISSRYNKDLYDSEMAIIEEEIKHGSFPWAKYTFEDDEITSVPSNVIVGTSTIREGISFYKESGITTIVCYEPSPTDIIQLVGRYRGDVEHLIVVYDIGKTLYSTTPNQKFARDAAYDLSRYVNYGDSTWLNNFKNILADDVIIECMFHVLTYRQEFYGALDALLGEKLYREDMAKLVELAKRTNVFGPCNSGLTKKKMIQNISHNGYLVTHYEQPKNNHKVRPYHIIEKDVI